ncbi:MAG: tetratricopeptide repeat protein [Saprospirales bacterium]|nr:tetratricopeptide repeat protein [Saprospirales bacterium]
MPRLTQLLALHADSPNDTFLLFALAKEYEKMGEEDNALAYYLQLRSVDPDYVGLYYHLGRLYQRRQDLDSAIDTYKAGMGVAKRLGDSHAYSELAGAKLEIADEDDEDF